MKNTLVIDTSSNREIIVELKTEAKKFRKTSEQRFGSQVLLKLIEDIITQANLTKTDLSEIEVMTGPGSFTGLRVGVAVANALAYSLKIPVNGKIIEDNLNYS